MTQVEKATLEEVLLHVHQLEERVAALERLVGQPKQAAEPAGERTAIAAPPVPLSTGFSFTGGNFAVVAKALLAFAGAYLLRAISESELVPQSIGILAGLAYAGFWLVWSMRLGAADRFRSTLYTLTSTLIFAGLIWENSVEVHAIPLPLGASLVALFVFTGMVMAVREKLPGAATIVVVGSASLALGLLLATHGVVAFTITLLTIAAACELMACVYPWRGQRWFPALIADVAVFLVAWVITRPQGLPESYPPFGMTSAVVLQMALVLVYVAAMGYRTLVTGSDITTFETVQNTAAIALFIWGSVVMGHGAPAARLVVDSFCLIAGLACYATAVLLLSRKSSQRNFRMYGIFGLALVMAGISIIFSGPPLVLVWCSLAVVVSWLGTHEHRMSLQLHAPVFLYAAAFGSGVIEFARQALHGVSAPSGAGLVEIVVVTVAIALCYWMTGAGEPGKERIPGLLIAGLLCWSILGLGGAGIETLLGPASTISSTLRTGLICGIALVLARSGARRPELGWLLYPLMVYGAYRLLLEDFPHGRPTALALSLLFYGGTLLLLTRILRAEKAG